MDIYEILEKINQYFPVSPEQYIKDYVDKVQKTILNCYEKEEYQTAHFHIYLLFMTYIYLVVYQTRTLYPKEHLLVIEYIRTYNNHDKDLYNIDKIFDYSKVLDSEILKVLALIDIDKSMIGKYKGASKNRDPMAHATGYYVINTQDEFETKTSILLDYFEEINNKLLHVFKDYYLSAITEEVNVDNFVKIYLFEKLNMTNSEYGFLENMKTKKLGENIIERHSEVLENILSNLCETEPIYESQSYHKEYRAGNVKYEKCSNVEKCKDMY